LRIEFEEHPKEEGEIRREIGGRVDASAMEGLRVLDSIPESSERERIRADLLATMIRSDFRAKKYEQAFNRAASMALEFDRDNPRAWVTAAKPLIFAPADRGRDLDEAIRHLDRALELDPALESALLLRALAHRELGDDKASETDLRSALDINPRCLPAKRALAGPP
jgi:tetratricopeptide (TPR) repeat protein